MFKKIRPIVILLSMLVMSSYLLWDNRYIFNSEPILDNKNYTNVLNSIIQDKDTTRCKKFNKKDLEQENKIGLELLKKTFSDKKHS